MPIFEDIDDDNSVKNTDEGRFYRKYNCPDDCAVHTPEDSRAGMHEKAFKR